MNILPVMRTQIRHLFSLERKISNHILKKIFSGIQRKTYIYSPVVLEAVLCTVDWRYLKHYN